MYSIVFPLAEIYFSTFSVLLHVDVGQPGRRPVRGSMRDLGSLAHVLKGLICNPQLASLTTISLWVP